jgi:hypothetical protein
VLVIVMEDHLLPPAAVCPSCPMASQSGLPRWHQGQLRCGRLVDSTGEGATGEGALPAGPVQYECAMGFRIAELEDSQMG